jgi:hypothetical protein
MKPTEPLKPPNWAMWLLRFICHPDFLEEIEGDLLEKFQEDLQKIGPKNAHSQLYRGILSIIQPNLIFHLNQSNMTTQKWSGLLLSALLIMTISVAPIIPGIYNTVLHSGSALAQTLGSIGLVFVPFGLIWALIELRNKKDEPLNKWTNGYYPALMATLPLVLSFLASFIAGITNHAWNSGYWVLGMIFFSSSLTFILYRIGKLKQKTKYHFNPTPIYLVLLPLFALFNSSVVIRKVAMIQREKIMIKSEPLINAIEKYKTEQGDYPEKLEDLNGKYISTIPKFMNKGTVYQYLKNNGDYQLSFERKWHWDAIEVVVYKQLPHERNKNPYKTYETSKVNWYYFMAD